MATEKGRAPKPTKAAASTATKAGQSAGKKAAPKKDTAKKAPAQKAAKKTSAAGDTATSESTRPSGPGTKQAGTKPTSTKKAGTKQTGTKQAGTKQAGTKKAAAAAQAPGKKPGAGTPAAKKPAAKKPAAKKASGKKAPGRTGASRPRLPVRAGEDPWSAAEVAEAHRSLQAERQRLTEELDASEEGLAEAFRDESDGAGDDQADVGSKTLEREQGISLAQHTRDMLDQVGQALDRIADGSYGTCTSCGEPIGKARLLAYPRATLCVACKQREERR